MKTITIALFFIVACVSSTVAQNKPQVMLMGTFHFANPGLDAVKVKTTDVMTADNQAYLNQLANNIAAFEPSMVLLEFDEKNTEAINQEYQQYLKGTFELPVNEIYQIGFRVAKKAGVKAVASFDERNTHWDGEAMFAHLQENDTALLKQLQEMIATMTETMNNMHATKTLRDLLLFNNDATQDQLNKSFYLLTNRAGLSDGQFVGADASASWWHRNFKMYARIQHHAQKHDKIFALGGQGHTAIIKSLMEADDSIQGVSVRPLLQ